MPKLIDQQYRLEQQFMASNKPVFNIPLGGKISVGKIILKGQIVLSAVTAAGTAVGDGGPLNLIQRIRLKTSKAPNSRYSDGYPVDCSPRSLMRYATSQRDAAKLILEQSGSTLGNGANGTYPIYVSIPIFFSDSNFRGSNQTALNCDEDAIQTCQVYVELGKITDCFSGWAGTVDYSGLTVAWEDDRFYYPGDVLQLWQEDHYKILQSAEQFGKDPGLPVDGTFQLWMLMAESTAAQTLVDTILQELRLTGQNIDYYRQAQQIRQKMLDDGWIDPSQNAAGLYLIDFSNGKLNSGVTAADLVTSIKSANPGGAGLDQYRVYTRRLFQPVNYQAAGTTKAA